MRCHPLLAGFKAPRKVTLGPYRMHILGPEDVEEDFRAVTEGTDRLLGLMNSEWPRGLTLDNNRIDLCWHLREFETKRSFAWIVRDKSGAYLGCAYIFPDFGGNGAWVPVWMRSSCGPVAQEQAFGGLLMDWLNGPAWPDFAFRLHRPNVVYDPESG